MANQPMGLEGWVANVYADKVLTNTEFQALRDEADAVYEAMSAALPGSPDLPAFQKLADEAVQCMQKVFLLQKKPSRPRKSKRRSRRVLVFRSPTSRRVSTGLLKLCKSQ